ncbi:MAG: class I SAM-dependent DNA methyltransferase [Verrucomicrobia bacterium]|jgi:type II restriction/modification system DNA methylase subunit YeeA|nr:class I SAM-dependent DNA methyltransferase [Verrucomicrobiota bacterium]
MTAAEFKKKWHRYTGKESAAYQEHFNDLCRLLGHPTPVEADPSGNDFFCFQKGVIKDAEMLGLAAADPDARPKKGFADVWKKDGFGWEYKGKHKNLDEAYRQLQKYRESLLNPPLMVVCDFDRYIVKTNFNGTVCEPHEFTNDQIDRPEILALLRHIFFDPGFLKPQRTTAQVTEKVAGQLAEVARSLQNRESVELADARTRAEVNVAQKKNLRIARFLNRIVFCFFAEDTLLLPKDLFTDIIKSSLHDPQHFAETTESLFRVMAKGGTFGKDKIRHFNGHLFEDATVFELTEEEIRKLAEAAEADWQFIQPSIMGTLFQRALDESHRAQLGAHYTGEDEIKTIVEPVLMAPLRREWAALKATLRASLKRGKGAAEARAHLQKFLKKLRSIIVLDPACGSGNFLYVSLQMLLALEKEVITFAAQLGFSFQPEVSVQQLKAIEINSYAFELAQVSVQIGWLQWRRDNGFDNDRSPVLQNLDGFENKDALLNQTFRKKPKSLKEAQAEEHAGDDALKVYTERAWPECDVLVGNPPFLGDKLMRGELGDDYVEELRKNYGNRIPGQSDLCCYWFEKARDLIEHGKCKRAGLLATQGIRGGANREVLKRIKETGDIFFAESDRNWILAGANVHVSMIGFDNGSEETRILDSRKVKEIQPNLTALSADISTAQKLKANRAVGFIGTTKKARLDVSESVALELLRNPNPNNLPSSDVVVPYLNAEDVVRRNANFWIIDFPVTLTEAECAAYEAAFGYVRQHVYPLRVKHREDVQRKFWWRLARPCPEVKEALEPLSRFLVTSIVSKHRLFAWHEVPVNPDHALAVFARADDYFFGILHSRFHEVWALKQGTRLETRPRYTPTTCFETFPFPFADDLAETLDNLEAELNAAKHYAHIVLREEPPPRTPAEHRTAIAAAAKELNELRERWLNPPEWTRTEYLEFPASVDGPWARYIDPNTVREVGRVTPCTPSSESNERRAEDCPPYLVGTVRYPRLVPQDADCAAKLKKRTLTNLYNERPAWLDLAHKKLDAAAAAAYGWPADLSDEQILEKLLALNLARAAEEAKAEKDKKPKAQRTKHAEELL